MGILPFPAPKLRRSRCRGRGRGRVVGRDWEESRDEKLWLGWKNQSINKIVVIKNIGLFYCDDPASPNWGCFFPPPFLVPFGACSLKRGKPWGKPKPILSLWKPLISLNKPSTNKEKQHRVFIKLIKLETVELPNSRLIKFPQQPPFGLREELAPLNFSRSQGKLGGQLTTSQLCGNRISPAKSGAHSSIF